MVMPRTPPTLKTFLQAESTSGILLAVMAALALFVANSAWSTDYFKLLALPVSVIAGGVGIAKPLLLWINDGLMALFFFRVGLEVKREVMAGQLASWRQASLPLFAAIGGMLAPAAIFLMINGSSLANIHGWAIPVATDIAFALGVLMLLGNRVSMALKALLLAIAVIDDIGAIAIIALFYAQDINWVMLLAAAGVLALMSLLGRVGVARSWPYALLGLLLWLLVLQSGVHATLAGVAAAFTIPMAVGRKRPLERMEHILHPWVAILIVPIFAFANAGVNLRGVVLADIASPLPLGIALGLILGKQLGIMGAASITVKAGWASLPAGVSWRQLHGLSVIAGIGFTMSLFIGNLAFTSQAQIAAVKLGVLGGSMISALCGYFLLRLLSVKPSVK
jgi:Na+:H+ antiporter, NhaA family